MKIEYGTTPVLFKELNDGDAFVVYGCGVYIKIDDRAVANDVFRVNAIDLEDGSLRHMHSDAKVYRKEIKVIVE